MVVIADCSPLNYLILIEAIDLLPKLFGKVMIPEAVARELQRANTPPAVARWMAASPDWLQISPIVSVIDDLGMLDEGEREAISLALEVGPDALLLIDESRGRAEAARLNIRVMGVLGILRRATIENLINLPDAIERLRRTNFHVAPGLLKALLDDARTD